jgi:hypothetical protein
MCLDRLLKKKPPPWIFTTLRVVGIRRSGQNGDIHSRNAKAVLQADP